MDNVLLTLKSLRWKDIVSPQGQDAARYGLDKPELEITLAKSGDTEVGTLVVGKRDGDVSYVRLKTAPAIYAVDDRLVADLRKASTDILNKPRGLERPLTVGLHRTRGGYRVPRTRLLPDRSPAVAGSP